MWIVFVFISLVKLFLDPSLDWSEVFLITILFYILDSIFRKN
jgi:hypothetical protein